MPLYPNLIIRQKAGFVICSQLFKKCQICYTYKDYGENLPG